MRSTPSTARSIPWAANQVIKNGGTYDGAILDLFTDGTSIYGNGFTFGRDLGQPRGRLQGRRRPPAQISWVEDCHGDTYQAAPMNGYVYIAGHAHFCGNTGGFPQSSDEHNALGPLPAARPRLQGRGRGHAPP